MSRQLTVTHELPDSDDVIAAAFYDFSMDGTLDVIISTKSEDKYEMKAYKNNIADDVMFLRVQASSITLIMGEFRRGYFNISGEE